MSGVLTTYSAYVLALEGPHSVQDGGNNIFVADRSIDHYVVERPGGPIGAKIMFYKQDALAVYGIYQVLGVAQAPAHALNAAQLFCAWRIKKHMERVSALTQEVRGAAPYDHTIASLGNVAHHFLADFHHPIWTKRLV